MRVLRQFDRPNFNIGTGIVSAPGRANLDPALSGTIAFNRLCEKCSPEFFAEFYNALNHQQFANPAFNFRSPIFGVISGTAVNARPGKLAQKFGF